MPSPLDSYSIENKLAAAGFSPEQISRVISSNMRGKQILGEAAQGGVGVVGSPLDTGLDMAALRPETPETDRARQQGRTTPEITAPRVQPQQAPAPQPVSQQATPFDRMGQATTPWGTPMRDLDVTKAIQAGEHSQQGPNGEGGGKDGFLGGQSWQRALADFSAGLLAGGSQPGASFTGALGHGALNFLQSRDAREAAAAEQAWDRYKWQREDQRSEREMEHDLTMDEREQRRAEQEFEHEQEIAEAKLQIERAKANRDKVAEVETIDGRMVGITESGRRIDLGEGERMSDAEAVKLATSLADETETDPMTGTEIRSGTNREMYNDAIKKMGKEHLALDEDINPAPMTADGQIDQSALMPGQKYQLADGTKAEWTGEVFQVIE